jgi:hypothetical protein
MFNGWFHMFNGSGISQNIWLYLINMFNVFFNIGFDPPNESTKQWPLTFPRIFSWLNSWWMPMVTPYIRTNNTLCDEWMAFQCAHISSEIHIFWGEPFITQPVL